MKLGLLARLLRQAPLAAAVVALKTPIMVATAVGSPPPNASIRYAPPCGGEAVGIWNSSASRPDTPVACGGTISNLAVRLPVALTAGQTWAFTLVVNGVDSALSVTIDSTGLVKFDNTHSIAVNAGDFICFKSSPSGTPNAQTNIQISCLFTAASGQVGPMFTAWVGGTTGTGYGVPGTCNSSVQAESSRRAYMPSAGTITKLYVNLNAAPGVGASRTVTLMKNGIDTGLTITIADNATSGSISGNVSFVASDLIQLRKDISGTAVTSLTLAALDWQPVTTGETLLLSAGTGNFDSTSTLFQTLQGTSENIITTETSVQNLVPVACSLTKFRSDMGTAPGAGASRTMTVRKNAADTAAAVTVSNASTSGQFSGSVAFASGDLADWSEVPSASPAATNPLSASGILVVT